MRLTSNFQSSEFDIHEPWPAGATFAVNRLQLAQLLQWLRDLAGVPVFITSAWRSAARNAAIGGSTRSQHLVAEAGDAVAWLIPMRSLAARVLADVRARRAPAFGQVIFYPTEGHVHISLPTLGHRNGEIRYKSGSSYPFLTSAELLPLWSIAQRGRGLWLGAIVAALGLIIVMRKHAWPIVA